MIEFRESSTLSPAGAGTPGRLHQPPASIDDRQLGHLAGDRREAHDYGCSLKVFRAEVVKR
jgi:hypothetical protein